MPNIMNVNNTNNIAKNQQYSDIIGAKQGELNGRALQLTQTPSNNLADAAEEMSFVLNLFKGKSLNKRKMSSGKKLSRDIEKRIKKIKTITNIQAVKDLLNQLSQKKQLSYKMLSDLLKDFSDDPVDQFLVLEIALEQSINSNEQDKIDTIKEVSQEIYESNKTLIKAANNISEQASEYSDMGTIKDIRENYADTVDKYSDHVRDDKTLQQLHSFLLEKYGVEGLKKAITLQLKLLATDIAMMKPSSSIAQLRAVINDLSQLKQLTAIYDDCVEAEDQIARSYPEIALKKNELIKQMLHMVQQQWVTETDFDSFSDTMNIEVLAGQIFILTKVIDMIRMIPETVFINEETKQSIIVAAKERLDSKIEQEASIDFSHNEPNESILDEIDINIFKQNN